MSPYVELSPSIASGGTPGGADTQVQFNNAGVFGGSANLTWNNTTSVATITGQLAIAVGSATSIVTAGVVESASFKCTGTNAVFSPASSGNISLRPAGPITNTGQIFITTTSVTMNSPVTLPADPTTALQATTKQYVDARTNLNLVINGDFRINQGGYVSAAVLAAGLYGHDQWKAGAAGGDYSFTQLASSTQVTIASGKTLIQPIEDVRVAGGSYVLSWTGTAQARYGVNTLTPAGTYAASPVLIAGQTAGTAMSIEFNAGTLGTVKLERGSIATPFVMPDYASELLACQRYYQNWVVGNGYVQAVGLTNNATAAIPLVVPMRAVPTMTLPWTDANYIGGALTATTWQFANPGVSAATKTGTVTVGTSTTAGAVLALFYGATFSIATTAINSGASIPPVKLSARL